MLLKNVGGKFKVVFIYLRHWHWKRISGSQKGRYKNEKHINEGRTVARKDQRNRRFLVC